MIDLLQRSLRSGRLSHAYLIAGPPHVGKMTLAVGLSQAVNCESGEPPCGVCRSCQRIAAGKHPDIKVMSLLSAERPKEKPRTEIGIDDVRDMQHEASLPPYEGRYKVFVVDGTERLSTEAANSVLKILEEPPPRVLILLLSSREHELLPTVTSRCQRLEMRPLSASISREVLVQRWGADPEKADLMARLSGGCLGWAVSALADAEYLERRRQDIAALNAVVSMSYRERFNVAAEWTRRFERSRDDIAGLLNLWLGWWRDVLLVRAGCPAAVTNIDLKSDLEAQAAQFITEEALSAAGSVFRAIEQLSVNANPRLVLEVLMLAIPGVDRAKTSQTVAGKV